MENKAQEKKQKIDWKKKGLGWVPDYPDLRDYNPNDDIKTNLRLKVENTTAKFESFAHTFESFASQLSELIDSVKNDNVLKNQLQTNIKELKNQLNPIDSGILFKKVKIHKLLISEEIQEIQDIQINKLSYESILPKQILDLKKYLGTLVLLDYLSFPKFLQELREKHYQQVHETLPQDILEDQDLRKYLLPPQGLPGDDQSSPNVLEDVMTLLKKHPSVVKFWINWMKDITYDVYIATLVERFQCQAGIVLDGIVGSETYNTLSDCFTDPQRLLQLKNSEKPTSQSKIKLLPVASLIPEEAYEKILNILKSKCTEQICKELRENKDVFENKFLKKLFAENPAYKNLFQNMFTDMGNDFPSVKDNDIRNILDKFQKDYFKTNDIFVFHIIEPIVSVIIRSISPLAQYKDIEEIVEKGFEKFSEVITNNNKSDLKSTSHKNINWKLVEVAISKVKDSLKEEIEDFVQTPNDKDKNFIYFYFLLDKCLNDFESSSSEEQIKIDTNQDFYHNIFDRQEFFEIAAKDNSKQEDKNEIFPTFSEQEDKNEIFPTFSLYIPLVSNKFLLKELDKNEKQVSEKQKLYLFLPSVVDLSFWCSPVRDQGSLNSCTAFAAVALLEYFAKRNSNHYTDASPLFLYKAARNKMNATGDVGASIRETIKVLALFGVPPEESWPYDEDKVDDEPLPYCYAYAQNYKILKYFLLDYPGIPTENLLFQIKAVLAAGFPCIFGFTIYTSAYENSNSEKGHIPYPEREKDKVVGAHTVVAVGYDDDKLIQCADRKKYSKGAFLIRNSWGPEWGKDGYGWLPYDYVLVGLTSAWWSLLNSEWFDEDNFGSAAKGGEGPTGQP